MSLLNNLKEQRSENLISTNNLLYQDDFIISRGEMQYLFDQENNKYLDMLGGFSVIAMGHANPYINEEIINQLSKVTHSTQIFLNEPIVKLAQLLHQNLDDSLTKTFFLNSGSEANEMAINLARIATGKSDILYMENSLHGRTKLTLEVTNMTMWHPYPQMNDQNLLVLSYYPNDNCSFDTQMELSLQDVKSKLESNANICAMIVEPIQGNAGVKYPHRDYFKRLKELLNSYGVLLILDEAQTGLGRLGYTYAHQYYDVVPDILMTCKSLGNGLPISSVTTTNLIAEKYKTPNASTTGGNMVSCASAIGVLNYYKEFNILENVRNLTKQFDQILESLNQKFDIILSVRGVGFMRGIEVSPKVISDVIAGLKRERIIVGVSGTNRSVLLLEPPLVITKEDLDYFEKSLIKVLENIKTKEQ